MHLRRILLSALALALVAAGCGETEHREVAAGGASTTTAAAEPSPRAGEGEWRAMAEPPASVAPNAPAVWTGSEVIVWGGGAPIDGAKPFNGGSYDPAANTWEELPAAPVKSPAGHTAVWTGREVLFWGGIENSRYAQADLQRSEVAYDPAKKTWRQLPPAPLDPRTYHEAVWTGREMIVWGGVTRCCPIDSVIHDAAAAAYDPETNTWRALPELPEPWTGDGGSAVTTAVGESVFVWRAGKVARGTFLSRSTTVTRSTAM